MIASAPPMARITWDDGGEATLGPSTTSPVTLVVDSTRAYPRARRCAARSIALPSRSRSPSALKVAGSPLPLTPSTAGRLHRPWLPLRPCGGRAPSPPCSTPSFPRSGIRLCRGPAWLELPLAAARVIASVPPFVATTSLPLRAEEGARESPWRPIGDATPPSPRRRLNLAAPHSWLATCASSRRPAPASCRPPAQSDGVRTFANPPELAPDAQNNYTSASRPPRWRSATSAYCLRTYNGSVPGPRSACGRGRTAASHVTLRNELTRLGLARDLGHGGATTRLPRL